MILLLLLFYIVYSFLFFFVYCRKAFFRIVESGYTKDFKFNRSQEENEKALQHSKCHTSTIANVLNVIDSIEAMKQVLALSKKMAEITFISVYEGDKSGKGRKTKDDCYQQNKRLKEYLPIVKQVFDVAEIKQGMIIAQ